jgi:hypothetical protein
MQMSTPLTQRKAVVSKKEAEMKEIQERLNFLNQRLMLLGRYPTATETRESSS